MPILITEMSTESFKPSPIARVYINIHPTNFHNESSQKEELTRKRQGICSRNHSHNIIAQVLQRFRNNIFYRYLNQCWLVSLHTTPAVFILSFKINFNL